MMVLSFVAAAVGTVAFVVQIGASDNIEQQWEQHWTEHTGPVAGGD